MEDMIFNVGDRVRIKSLDWYNENKGPFGEICPDFIVFLPSRSKYCGQIMTIKEVLRNSYNLDLIYYKMIEDAQLNDWTNGMIEGLVKEESSVDLTVKGEKVKERIEITIPEGYEYVIESDKIIFTKKKEYPKTFLECCDVLDIKNLIERGVKGYKAELFDTLQKLYICRDAYWKIAGEEMGLGKPWEPQTGVIYHYMPDAPSYIRNIFPFPTPEMRDAFKVNFDPDIEICKELL